MAIPLIGLALGALRAVGGRMIASTAGAALRATTGRIGAGTARAGRGMSRGGDRQWLRSAKRMKGGASAPAATRGNVTTNNVTNNTVQNSGNSRSQASTVNQTLGNARRTSGLPDHEPADGTSRPSYDPEITELNSRDLISRIGQALSSLAPIGRALGWASRKSQEVFAETKAQGLGRYTGEVAYADAQLNVGRIARSIARAQYTGKSEADMTRSKDELEQAKEPFRAVAQKVKNTLSGAWMSLEASVWDAAADGFRSQAAGADPSVAGALGAYARGGYLGSFIGGVANASTILGNEVVAADAAQSNLSLMQQSFLGDMAHPKKDDAYQQAAKKFQRNLGSPNGPQRTVGGY